MPKPARTAAQLQQLPIEHIDAIPDLAGQVTDVHTGGVVWADPGEGGPNWTVPVLRDRGTHRAGNARIFLNRQMWLALKE